MNKEGFIYVWYDRKRKMYYVGCHWGTIDDGYICSSDRMREAYRRRQYDFTRRVVQRGILRESLLDEEHKWLQLISPHELGTKYYNLRQHKWGHWSTDSENSKNTTEKLKAYWTEEKREARSEVMKANNPMKNPDSVAKMEESLKGTTPWNKGKIGVQTSTRKGKKVGPHTEEHKEKIRKAYHRTKETHNMTTKIQCPVCHKSMSKPAFVRYNHGPDCRKL